MRLTKEREQEIRGANENTPVLGSLNPLVVRDEMITEIDALRAERDAFAKAICKLEDENKELRTQAGAHFHNLTETDIKLGQVTQELDELKKHCEALERDCLSKQNECNYLVAERTFWRDQGEKIRHQRDTAVKTIHTLGDNILKLQDENKKLKATTIPENSEWQECKETCGLGEPVCRWCMDKLYTRALIDLQEKNQKLKDENERLKRFEDSYNESKRGKENQILRERVTKLREGLAKYKGFIFNFHTLGGMYNTRLGATIMESLYEENTKDVASKVLAEDDELEKK